MSEATDTNETRDSEPPEDHSDRIKSLEHQNSNMQTELVGQEHWLIQVFYNAWRALRSPDWPLSRRLEAGGALVRYVFLGRATILLTIGLGGLLALHASFMLSDQNLKLDLENYLNTVNSELGEAQRNSQLSQLLAPLIQDLQAMSAAADDTGSLTTSRTYREVAKLDLALATRIAVLTQTFQPYRWIQHDTEASTLLMPEGSGFFYRFMTGLRSIYDSGFGSAAMEQKLAESKIPVLTAERRSPERGLLLVNLHAMGIDFTELTRFNTTFENSYAPGARLDGIDLGGIEGPGVSTPFDLGLADLSNATFARSNLQGVILTLSNLTLANFDTARAHNVLFRAANADQASFVTASLVGADFRDAYIGDANFDLADLTGANLTSARNWEDAKLDSACLVQGSTLMPPDATLI
jgi:pentapeptide repeat protein